MVVRETREDLLVNHNQATPMFFVSVASKGLSNTVSLLFATHTCRGSISVASKRLKGIVGSGRRE